MPQPYLSTFQKNTKTAQADNDSSNLLPLISACDEEAALTQPPEFSLHNSTVKGKTETERGERGGGEAFGKEN